MEVFHQAFVQEPDHRPMPDIVTAGGIPTIDLSPALSSDAFSLSDLASPSLTALVSDICEACQKWGFFQVINHGVSVETRHRIETSAKKFFAQPVETKRSVQRDEVNVWGYYDTEHTKNVRDWKEVFDFTVRDPSPIPRLHVLRREDGQEEEEEEEEEEEDRIVLLFNQWPEYPPELRDVCDEYTRAMEKLGSTLLGLIALSLGLPADRFEPYFREQSTYTRLNHYPACSSPDLALGVGRHKDAGALTILAQDDVGGLEVRRKSDGEWVFVEPTPDAFIINVGDIIQVWSNERYESVEHRVRVNKVKDRFSIPYFINPAIDVDVKPLPELMSPENPPRYRDYRWGRFFATRRLSNFKKLDVENIQIHHFKLELDEPVA